jgi:hypothetical protein
MMTTYTLSLGTIFFTKIMLSMSKKYPTNYGFNEIFLYFILEHSWLYPFQSDYSKYVIFLRCTNICVEIVWYKNIYFNFDQNYIHCIYIYIYICKWNVLFWYESVRMIEFLYLQLYFLNPATHVSIFWFQMVPVEQL